MYQQKDLRLKLFRTLRRKLAQSYFFIFFMLAGMIAIFSILTYGVLLTDEVIGFILVGLAGAIYIFAIYKFTVALLKLYIRKPALNDNRVIITLNKEHKNLGNPIGGVYHFGDHHEILVQNERYEKSVVLVASEFYEMLSDGDPITVIRYDDKEFAMPYIEGDESFK